MNRLSLTLPVLVLGFVTAFAQRAEAQNCDVRPGDVSGNWDIRDGTRLCSGTFNVTSLTLRGNRRLYIGGANDVGNVIINVETTAYIGGVIDGVGRGFAGGDGCSATVLNPRPGGAGSKGQGPGAGGGTPAFTTNGGAAGAGGGGHGGVGGNGAAGNAGGTGGRGGVSYGETDARTTGLGSGGGGGACNRYPVFGLLLGSSGFDGGAGGGSFVLKAKSVTTSLDAVVRVNGSAGTSATSSAGPGGGGSGGTIAIHATEQLVAQGLFEAAGGKGGKGGSDGQGTSGGAGGGAGGRVRLWGPAACPPQHDFDVSGGAAGGAGGAGASLGEAGRDGHFSCQSLQVPPSATLTATPSTVGLGESVLLTAVGEDANGHLLKYEFDCGDGTWSAPSTVATRTCSYTTAGTKTARVRVTDWNSIALPNGTTTQLPGTVAFGGSTTATTSVRVTLGEPELTFTATPNPANEGDDVKFKIDVVDSPADLAAGFTVVWNFGNGEPPVTETNVKAPITRTVKYPESGRYDVTVKVTDRNSTTSTASLALVVQNLPPVVTLLEAPTPLSAGTTNTFKAGARDTPGDLLAGFDYTFNWGDGSPATTVRGNETASTTHVYTSPGTYQLSVTALDRDNGRSTPATKQIVVNEPSVPVPPGPFTFRTLPLNGIIDEGQSMQIQAFWGDADAQVINRPYTFKWDFGDGSLPVTGTTTAGDIVCAGGTCSVQTTVMQPFKDDGNFNVRLTVKNANGLEGTGSVNVTVRNVPPVASISGPSSADEGAPVQFTLSATDASSVDASDGFTWVVSWHDGSPDTTVTGKSPTTVTHAFRDNGNYTVSATARDKDGGTSAPATRAVVVDNVAPSVVLTTPSVTLVGEELEFSALVTDSPADTAEGFTVTWDFGDGSDASQGHDLTEVRHVYMTAGTYDVSVTVVDKDGGQTVETATVVVRNMPLSVSLGSDLDLRRGEVFSIRAEVTGGPTDDGLTYEWSFGDGTTRTGETASHSYAAYGNYDITVVVTASDGSEASDSIVARVRNAPPVASNVEITPVNARAGDALTVSWTYTDRDNDAENGTTIRWSVDGQPLAQFNDRKVIPDTTTRRGQVWTATVTPNDGNAFGDPVRSPPRRIGNDAPTASNVRITPSTPRAFDALAVEYTYADPNGDPESGTTLRWTRNGAPVPALDNATTVPEPLGRGDSWQVTVTVRDGDLSGTPVTSDPVLVVNSAPILALIPDVAKPAEGAETPVEFEMSATDPDGDTVSYACELNGRVVATTSTVTLALPEGTHTLLCSASDGVDSTEQIVQIAIGDVAPVVRANDDMVVDPGWITLTADARDPLSRPLTYQWVVDAHASDSPPVLRTPSVSWTDLILRRAGDYDFRVRVSNGTQSADDSVRVTVRNVAPVASAGPSIRQALEGDSVRLDARASTDANGDALSYLWERVSGPAASFEGAETDRAITVIAENAGELVVRLTVSDGTLSSSTLVSIRIAPVDDADSSPPVALAGPNQRVLVGETVLLDGSKSYDVDGDTLTYAWSQREGTPVLLETPDTVGTTFVPSVPGTYVFVLTVFDGSFFDRATVTIEAFDAHGNTRPVAAVVPNELTIDATERVKLNGLQSRDPDGDTLTFRWTQVSGPTAQFVDAKTPTPTVSSLDEGTVVLALVVNDGKVDSLPAFVRIFVTDGNTRPVAIAKGPERVALGALATLDGTESYDPEGEQISYAWRRVEGPFVPLAGPGTPAPSFVPMTPGTYVFELVVHDGVFESEPARVEVLVDRDGAPVALIKAPAETFVHENVVFDGSDSADPEGATLVFRWTLVDAEGATLVNADTTQPTFVATQPGLYEVSLVVSDGQLESAPARHVILVKPLPEITGGCGCDAGAGASGLMLVGLLAVLRRRRRG